ncbi:MAG: hypothetical protein JW928_06925 [Candidatus Aureabacteria bacterium]|nr:hypothetical protein [Candidatus Auribacterota bacterium]
MNKKSCYRSFIACCLYALYGVIFFSITLFSDTEKGGETVLVHARKGIVLEGQISDDSVRRLLDEFGYTVVHMVKVKEYLLEGGDDGIAEVFLWKIKGSQDDIFVFCRMLEDEKNILHAQPFEEISKE